MWYFKNYIFTTIHYAAHFTTRCLFFTIIYYKASSKLLNSTNISFITPHGKIMLLGIESLNVIIFDTIATLILDIDMLQNKYS